MPSDAIWALAYLCFKTAFGAILSLAKNASLISLSALKTRPASVRAGRRVCDTVFKYRPLSNRLF